MSFEQIGSIYAVIIAVAIWAFAFGYVIGSRKDE
jgi:hypothetical protein